MPFVSEDCSKWQAHTPSRKLPKRKRKAARNRRGKRSRSNKTIMANARAKSKKLLKLDPSRTATLRNQFVRELKRRFNRLRLDVIDLIVKQDAFGIRADQAAAIRAGGEYVAAIEANAFCPTGEGGGVDPSCSLSIRVDRNIRHPDVEKVLDEDTQVAANDVIARSGLSAVLYSSKEPMFIHRSDDGAVDGAVVVDSDGGMTFDFGVLPEAQGRGVGKKMLEHLTAYYLRNFRKLAKKQDMEAEDYDLSAIPSNPVAAKMMEKLGFRKEGESYVLTGRRALSADLKANAFCPTGEGGGVDATCSPRGISLQRARDILDKVPGAKWMREQTAKITDRLTERYGAKQALAIVASGQAFGWGLSAVGTAVTGVPVYVPFSTVAGMLPGAALAEAYYRLSSRTKSKVTANYEQLSKEDIDRLGRELAQELMSLQPPVANTFCPTGAGGGVDPSCSPASKSENRLMANTRWRFNTDPEKVRAFQQWLKGKIGQHVLRSEIDKVWEKYAMEGFKKGAGRAFDDASKSRRFAAGEGDFYKGSKSQFLKDSFGQPVAIEKIKLLASRTYTDLEGVTEAMSAKMTRDLTDGLVEGKNPNDVADDLAEDIDGIGINRATVIARTEIMRAHSEGQLQAFEDLGVEELGVAVEWSTAGDERVCPICAPLEGIVLKIAEARNMLPRHPQCRCVWTPAHTGEDDEGQKYTKSSIGRAIDASVEREGADEGDEWIGADKEIAKQRPESILNRRIASNSFCPTGEGGGVDPSCSPGESASAKSERLEAKVKETRAKIDNPKVRGKARKALLEQYNRELNESIKAGADAYREQTAASLRPAPASASFISTSLAAETPLAAKPAPKPMSSGSIDDHVDAFMSSFDAIDAEGKGFRNYVHMADLRERSGLDKVSFDRTFYEGLRRGIITGSSGEGHAMPGSKGKGFSERDQTAWIADPDPVNPSMSTRYLFVSRRV